MKSNLLVLVAILVVVQSLVECKSLPPPHHSKYDLLAHVLFSGEGIEDGEREKSSNEVATRYLEGEKTVERSMPMTATFYSKEEVAEHMPAGGVRGVTLREAINGAGLLQASVDPRRIPLYSLLKIRLWDDVQVPAIAVDVGPSADIIDLFVDTVNEAIELGKKPVYVEVVSSASSR